MARLLRNLAPEEGYNPTAIPGIRILRSDRALTRTPVLYDPGIVIVGQGRKRGFFGDTVYVYDEQHYLAVSVPVPFSMETDATQDRPLLAVYMHLDFAVAAGLMVEIGRHEIETPVGPRSMMSSPVDPTLGESVVRLLEALAEPLDAAVLGPSLVREVYFRVLTGAQGQAMRAALSMSGQFGKVSRALRRIHHGYAQPLDIARLAQEAGMSAPTFFSHFKSVTQVSPMQYVKNIRLHQARLMMAREGVTAEAACHQVGYESASQFNREFRRLFGLPPMAEAKRLRKAYAIPPPQTGQEFVSSH